MTTPCPTCQHPMQSYIPLFGPEEIFCENATCAPPYEVTLTLSKNRILAQPTPVTRKISTPEGKLVSVADPTFYGWEPGFQNTRWAYKENGYLYWWSEDDVDRDGKSTHTWERLDTPSSRWYHRALPT